MTFKAIARMIALIVLASIPVAADQPPFSINQAKELHHLLLDGKGSFKATGPHLGYELRVLPNNSGYLMAYNAPGGGYTFRLDVNFRLISATHWNSTSAPPSAMPLSDATPLYHQDLVVWREILAQAGG
jgi:hypothetical protein